MTDCAILLLKTVLLGRSRPTGEFVRRPLRRLRSPTVIWPGRTLIGEEWGEAIPGLWVHRRWAPQVEAAQHRLVVRLGLVTEFVQEGFWFHAERVGDPVDVVEVGTHLRGVVDGAVIPAGCSQPFDVLLVALAGREGQLLRVRQEGPGGRIQAGRAPVGGKPIDQRLGFLIRELQVGGDLRPEVV